MTALEQRIKEAAEKAIITGLASQGKRHLGVEYLSAHTALEDFWQLITPESIKALLAEKDAEIKRLTGCLKRANDGLEEYERKFYLESDKVESLKARAEQLKENVSQVAAFLIIPTAATAGVPIGYGDVAKIAAPHLRRALTAYDALSGPREGEQDG